MRRWITLVAAVALASALAGCRSGDETQTGEGTASPAPGASATPAASAGPSVSPTATPAATVTPAATAAPSVKPKPASVAAPADAKAAVEGRANDTLAAMKAQDLAKLAKLAHPDKGVQFSPYAHIDTAKDVRLKASELGTAWTDGNPRTWGSYDGSGEPITLTFPAYFAKFVYNHDYSTAPDVGYNTIIGKSTTLNNVFDVYPKDSCVTVEYHFSGFDPQFDGNDWSSLRLVFEKSGAEWYLTAVIHDQFTM
ncbi:hypothetical protein B5M42_007645 [Paenibacillus athensensis]|uniref:Lipoprotein n=1 Tax=Paenibacillus athensensis TaxID=1967502 RepID=A0A4Y8Q3P0_9BACL|nr:hypothetical protein [Paenibacillus athensensis]MCD1258706.1 hypothetical protein [Paenibacillus athensensis]